MFNDIQKEIAAVAADRKINPIEPTVKTYAGNILSAPGTEKVILSTTDVDFMTCTAAGNSGKERKCLVLKGAKPIFDGQFVNSNGDITYIVAKKPFEAMVALVANTGKQIRLLKDRIATVENERDMYKLTIDSLRKNGVID